MIATTACPSSHELSRAISDGASAAIQAHLATCSRCTAEWAATVDVIALARALSAPPPSAERREEVRTTTLAASRTVDVLADRLRASPGPDRSRWSRGSSRESRARGFAIAGVAASALAAAAAVAVVVGKGPDTAPSHHVHGTVRPQPHAQYLARSTTPDEVVMLYDGTIDVEVAPLRPGERFRVIVADAEIEVHGTQFTATARHGTLVALQVSHGLVEVRPSAGAAQLLRAGEAWRAPVAKSAEAPVVAPPAAPAEAAPASEEPAKRPPLRTAPPPSPAAAKPAAPTPAPAAKPAAPAAAKPTPSPPNPLEALPQERAYDDAWAAMRASRFDDAAKSFLRVQFLDPGGPLAEDATYWYAVATARAGHSTLAHTAFRDFLDRYPQARRAGEASAMLGWLLIAADQRTDAERRFRAAIRDPNPAVRKSAQAGLDALARPK